jgi:hypothetical protein
MMRAVVPTASPMMAAMVSVLVRVKCEGSVSCERSRNQQLAATHYSACNHSSWQQLITAPAYMWV